MTDPSRTNQKLIEENAFLKQRIRELELSEPDRKRAEDELRESEENYRVLFEGINDAVFMHELNEEGLHERFLRVNDVACRRLEYTREELLSLTPRDITMPAEYERIADKRIGLASRGDILVETIHVTKDGMHIPVESNIRQFQYLGKQVALSISRDITDRKQAEAAIRNAEQRLHSIIDGSPIPAFVIGKDHRVIHWNKALEEMSRIKSEEIVGTCEHWKAFYNEERLCMADLLVDEAVELVPKWYSGKYIKSPLIENAYEATDFFPALGQNGKWLRFTAAAIRDSKGMIVAAVETLEDITERKQAEENLKHLSVHDSLTGLHNRFLFEEELRRFSTGRFDPIGIVMCDLDGLKLVNDNLGHDVGDRLIITAAHLLKEQFRSSDIVARIGGDEFAVLLSDCPPEMTKEICGRLKQAMINRYIPDTKIPLMMSVGYATCDGKKNSVEELVKKADVNMYKEKIQNRQKFREFFDNLRGTDSNG